MLAHKDTAIPQSAMPQDKIVKVRVGAVKYSGTIISKLTPLIFEVEYKKGNKFYVQYFDSYNIS